MDEFISKAYNFEELCRNILNTKISNVEKNVKLRESGDIDLILIGDKDIKIAVEVKYYRTRRPTKGMLLKVIDDLIRRSGKVNINKQIIITNLPVDIKLKEEIFSEFHIRIIDNNNLIYLMGDNEELHTQYRIFMSEIPKELKGEEAAEKFDIHDIFIDELDINTLLVEPYNESKNLQRDISIIPCGAGAFRDYENKCTEVLKYLFAENLIGWNEQLRTDDGLNRYDLICRINRGNEFWEFLIDEFHSRYILFEFKNYCENVKQTQIYTTEKYLFNTALRNVCFLISRRGLDDNADLASKGILRENGKLIVGINDDDLIKMLEIKGTGGEPSDYLFELVDTILLKLSK